MTVTAKDIYEAVHRLPETWGKIWWDGNTIRVIVWGTGNGDKFTFPENQGVVWDDEYLFHTHPRGVPHFPSQTDLSNEHVPNGCMFVFGEGGVTKFSPGGEIEEYPPDYPFGADMVVYWLGKDKTGTGEEARRHKEHSVAQPLRRFFALIRGGRERKNTGGG